MRLSNIEPHLERMDATTLRSLVRGLFAIIASNPVTYADVRDRAIPTAERIAHHSKRFESDIRFACDLLKQTSDFGIRQVIEKKEKPTC